MAGVPGVVVEQYRRSQRLQAVAQRRARRAWALVSVAAVSESWGEALGASGLVAAVSSLQVQNASGGASYGAQALAAQGLSDPVEAYVDATAFGGFTGAGTPLGDALFFAAPHSLTLIRQGASPAEALRRGGLLLESQVKTAVADAGRQAAGVDNFARAKTGYVRMLNPPSCSRCALLAGKFYRHNAGFRRHPRCDCIHIPTQENAGEDLRTDPYAYFESLSADEQDKAFTKAGAQAIRDGSDIFQVVNSRKGMSYNGTSADGSFRGQRASAYTTAGTTRRGYANSVLGGNKRLTPEAIYLKGLPRDQTLRLLEQNGYLLKGGQNPGGSIAFPAPVQTSMSAAEKRVQQARLNWQAVLEGRHPQSGRKLTPAEAARYEDQYRYWLTRKGEIFTQ